MSLLEKAQQLFEVIRAQPLLDEIKKLILKFKPSEYGVLDNNYPMYLPGLLLQDPQKIDKSFGELVSSLVKEFISWDDDKKNILLDVCNQVYQLNELCIAPLTKESPHYTFILNPYYWFPGIFEHFKLDIPKDFKKHLFGVKEPKEIANAFYETPAFKYAISTLSKVKDNPLQIHAEQAVIKLNEDLMKAGTRKGINLFGELEEKELDIFHRHLVSLLCIKDSLSNLNQLIYQAIIQDKLSTINRDDIIDYLISWTESGEGIAVKYLVTRGELYGIELFDLVILNLDNYGINNSICRVETVISLQEFLDTVDIEVRVLDKNLNAYGDFIQILNKEEKSNS